LENYQIFSIIETSFSFVSTINGAVSFSHSALYSSNMMNHRVFWTWK